VSYVTNYLAGIALFLCGCSATVAFAQNAPATRQQSTAADAGTTAQPKCIAENGDFKQRGKSATFTIELANQCEQRLKCRVYAYVTSAKGSARGRATLILAPKSHGAAAKKSYALKVKMLSGTAEWSRDCRVLH
jgi:hypothetical protein